MAGRGGMGIVYRATQLSLGRPVALKLIAAEFATDPGFRERFQREARLAAAIDHPNVVPVHAAGEDDGRLYLVMRFVEGTDLQALLRAEGRLEPARAAAIVAQVAAALDAAHAAGLVHRDVKPANVLLAGEHVYLTDFGLTRQQTADMRITTTGEWIGTVDFMSPERLQSRPTDARSDVYALGCVLYATLTGAVPFPRGTVPATMLAHLNDAPPRPSGTAGVPREFDAVVGRALAKAAAERYPSAGDLGRATLAAARHEHVTDPERSVARGPAAPTGNGAAPAGGERPSSTDATAVLREQATAATTPLRREPDRSGGDRPPAVAARGAGPDRPGDDRPGRTHRTRRRLRRAGLAAAGAAAALVAGLALTDVVDLGGAERPANRPVAAGEVRDAVDAFAAAYAAEDAGALTRLLARRVDRVFPGARQRGRDAVVAVYRRQFADNDTRDYRIEDLAIQGGSVGRASGRYRAQLTSDPPITGRIVFGVIRERGRPRIGLIAAMPDV